MENATAAIWKVLLVVQKRFRRLDAPHLPAEVAEGAIYFNGVRVTKTEEEQEAA